METHVTPRAAASVILLRTREASGEVEVFLLCRHRGASFMSSAFVFPGGAADPGEDDLRVTAARELFEEAGVLLATTPLPGEGIAALRATLDDGDSSFAEKLAAAGGGTIDVATLQYYSHWITPSIERKRFSALFYLARLPAGQTPSIDNKEAVDHAWVTPAEALDRAGELRLPPPQVRTLWELARLAPGGIDSMFAHARALEDHRHAILPRHLPTASPLTLLLPWDPDYTTIGAGDGLPMPSDHPLAVGPSRYRFEDMTWKLFSAHSSPGAE